MGESKVQACQTRQVLSRVGLYEKGYEKEAFQKCVSLDAQKNGQGLQRLNNLLKMLYAWDRTTHRGLPS